MLTGKLKEDVVPVLRTVMNASLFAVAHINMAYSVQLHHFLAPLQLEANA